MSAELYKLLEIAAKVLSIPIVIFLIWLVAKIAGGLADGVIKNTMHIVQPKNIQSATNKQTDAAPTENAYYPGMGHDFEPK